MFNRIEKFLEMLYSTSVFERRITWRDSAFVKVWQKSLRKRSKKKELYEGTWNLKLQ